MRFAYSAISRRTALLFFLIILALAASFFVWFRLASAPKAHAQTIADHPEFEVRVSGTTNHSPSYPGDCNAGYVSDWGSTATGTLNNSRQSGGFDVHCIEIRFKPGTQADQYTSDFQLCFSLTGRNNTDTLCNRWASLGGSFLPRQLSMGSGQFSSATISVNTRPAPPGMYFSGVRAGIGLYYKSQNDTNCGAGPDSITYTDSANWGWSQQSDDDPGCANAGFYVKINSAYDAQFVRAEVPAATQTASNTFTVSPNTNYPGNLVMHNTGNPWYSTAAGQLEPGSADCTTVNYTYAGQTCDETRSYHSDNIKLVRTDSESNVTAPAQLDYKQIVSYHYVAREYVIDPGYPPSPPGGCNPDDPKGNEACLIGRQDKGHSIKQKLAAVLRAIIPSVFAQTSTALTVDTTQTGNTDVFSTDPETNFPGFNFQVNGGTGPYILTYRMQKIDGSAVGTDSNGFFGETAIVNLNLTGPPDFKCLSDTSLVQQDPGKTGTYTLRAVSLGGFSGQVAVSVTAGLPAGTTASTGTINVPAGGSDTTPITVTIGLTTPAGLYDLTFSGSSPGYDPPKTCHADLQVNDVGQGNGPSVFLTASTPSVNSPSDQFSLTWTPSNSTSCVISPATTPANSAWVLNDTRDASGGSHTQDNLSISATTTFSLTCSKPGFDPATGSVTVNYNPNPSFTISPNSQSFTAQQYSLIIPDAKDFSINNTGNVDLTFNLGNNKPWLNLSVNSVFVPAGQSRSVSVQPNTTDSLSPNPDTATVTFNSNSAAGSLNRPVDYTLTNYDFDCSHSYTASQQGDTAFYTVTAAPHNGYNGTIVVSSYSSPAGPTASNVTLNSGNGYSSSVAVNTANAPHSGSPYQLTFTATDGNPARTKTCSAELVVNATPTYTLSISKTGSGSGTVSGNPGPISCGSTCSADYTAGTTVTLTASPAGGSSFDHWSGNCAGTGATCTLTMSSAKSATAQFNGPPGGGGSFNFDCSHTYTASQQGDTAFYTVTAAPQNGYSGSVTVATTSQPSGPTASNVTLNSGNSYSGSVAVNTSSAPPSGSPYQLTFTATDGNPANTKTCPAELIVSSGSGGGPVVVGFQCSSDNNSFSNGPCPVSGGGTGYLEWSSQNAAACSMNQSLLNYNTPAASPPAPNGDTSVPLSVLSGQATKPLNSNTTFKVTCTAGGLSDFKTVDFTISAAGAAVSPRKIIVCVKSGSAITRFNTGACPGAPGALSSLSAYTFKAGDIVTFNIGIYNTGNAGLDMGSKTLTMVDAPSNMTKPTGGWNAVYVCGTGCEEEDGNDQNYVGDNFASNGTISLRFAGKSGNASSRSIPPGGVWSVNFDAAVKSPPSTTPQPYRFYNCVNSFTLSPNPQGITFPASACLDNPYLFIPAGPGAPDRHEIAP